MKNYILIAAAIFLSLTACEPEPQLRSYNCAWCVRNDLGQSIKVKIPIYKDENRLIPPGESVRIQYQVTEPQYSMPHFNGFYDDAIWENLDEQDRRIDILSAEGRVLKTWYYAKKDDYGRQFFNKEDWREYTLLDEEPSGETLDCWVFTISPQDTVLIDDQTLLNQ